jgi:hypothetical protein
VHLVVSGRSFPQGRVAPFQLLKLGANAEAAPAIQDPHNLPQALKAHSGANIDSASRIAVHRRSSPASPRRRGACHRARNILQAPCRAVGNDVAEDSHIARVRNAVIGNVRGQLAWPESVCGSPRRVHRTLEISCERPIRSTLVSFISLFACVDVTSDILSLT